MNRRKRIITGADGAYAAQEYARQQSINRVMDRTDLPEVYAARYLDAAKGIEDDAVVNALAAGLCAED